MIGATSVGIPETGTTYDFGNTLVTVPSQYVLPAANGSDVKSMVAWLNSLGFYSAQYGSAPANPGNAKLIQYGALYIWIPNQYVVSGNDTQSLANLLASLLGQVAPTTAIVSGNTDISGVSPQTLSWVETKFNLSAQQIAGNATLVTFLRASDEVIKSGLIPASITNQIQSILGGSVPSPSSTSSAISSIPPTYFYIGGGALLLYLVLRK